jgi:hypothetical protein
MWFSALTPIAANTATFTSTGDRNTSATASIQSIKKLSRTRATSFLLINSIGTTTTSASQTLFYTPGNYNWTAPAGVTSVSVVCIGGGGAGDGWPGNGGYGGIGAVRIIWGGGSFQITNDTPDDSVISVALPGAVVRAYPQTNTADV